MAGCSGGFDCGAKLAELCDAYFNVLQDGSLKEVTSGDDTTEWHNNNLPELKAQITRMHAQCPSNASAMIVGGSGRRAPRGVCFEESAKCRGGGC